MQSNFKLVVGLLLALAGSAHGQERVAISLAAVQQVLEPAAGNLALRNMRLLAPVTTTESQPALVADQLHYDPSRGWLQARLRCRNPDVCLPFFAVATPSLPPDFAVARLSPAGISKAAPVLRAGQQATLVLEREGMRITMPATILEPGARGQQVAVRTAAHSVVRARIEDDHTVRGSL